MQSVMVSRLKSIDHRRRLTDRVTYLLLQAAPNLFDLFNHIERAQHAAYLEAKTRIYASKPLHNTTSTTTHALFRDVPERTRSALVHYSLRHVMHYNSDNNYMQGIDRNEWKKCATISSSQSRTSNEISQADRVAAVTVGCVYSESCRASAVSIGALSDDTIAAKFAPLYESCGGASNNCSASSSSPVGCR